MKPFYLRYFLLRVRHKRLLYNSNYYLFQCMCPAQGRSYPSCPTGYVYDYMEECRCVAVSVLGELELEIALAVTFLSLLATILSLVQCYRRGIGLFR